MKLGARIFKTGTAITLAIYVATLLQLSAPAFAGVSAIFALQPTVYRSYKTLQNQFQANILGAILAVLFTLGFGNNPIIIGVTCIVMLGIAIRLKMADYVSIALVTIVAIMEYSGNDFLYFAFLRFVTTFVGLISASIINLFFLPPKYEVKLFQELEKQTKEISSWIRIVIHQVSDSVTIRDEIEKHTESLIKLRYFYLLYKEEHQKIFKKEMYSKARKLVLFRKMVAATDEVFEILKLFYRLEPQLHHLPEELQRSIKANLEHLITYHEQVLLKFVEKVRVTPNQQFTSELQEKYEELIIQFSSFSREENDHTFIHLIQLVSAITTYKEKIESLDELMSSFHKFHQEEKKLRWKKTTPSGSEQRKKKVV